ncbi:hypothetical protein V8F20_009569 [Naviculisporaceae sp. PSN 640]
MSSAPIPIPGRGSTTSWRTSSTYTSTYFDDTSTFTNKDASQNDCKSLSSSFTGTTYYPRHKDNDSGYGTQNVSVEDKDDSGFYAPIEEPKIKSTPLPGRDDIQVFRKDIDASVTARYREIMPELHRLLARQLSAQQSGTLSGRRLFSSGRRAKSRSASAAVQMSLRLMTVGVTVQDAKAAIVVFTQGEQTSGLERLTRQPLMQQLCQPDDTITPSFEVIVVGEPARKRGCLGYSISAVFDDALGRDSSTVTYCGARILFDAGGGANQFAAATLGGLIKLTFAVGDFMLVGMTAGHVLEDLFLDDEDSESEDSPNFGNEPTSEECSGTFGKPKRRPMGELLYPLVERPDPEEGCTELGLPDIPPRDWALFEMDTSLKLKPNLIPREIDAGAYRHLHQQPPRRPYDQGNCLSAAAPESFPFTEPIEVVMISSNGKTQSIFYGELSHTPSTIVLNNSDSEEIVEAYILTLDEKKDHTTSVLEDIDTSTLGQIQDGHSGAWVVNPVSMEVYGHVVATDFTGDAYVIPLHATFDEIKEKMPGVEKVSLPGVGDLLDAALRSGMKNTGRRKSTHGTDMEDGDGPGDRTAHEKVCTADRDRRTSEIFSLCGGAGRRASSPKPVDLDSDLDSGYGSGCGSVETAMVMPSAADLDKDRERDVAVEGADMSGCRPAAGRERRRRQSLWLDSEDAMCVSVW